MEKELSPCKSEIYESGECAAILAGANARTMEEFVRCVAEYTGQEVDWHYFGGRAVVKTTGDVEAVRMAVRLLLIKMM